MDIFSSKWCGEVEVADLAEIEEWMIATSSVD